MTDQKTEYVLKKYINKRQLWKVIFNELSVNKLKRLLDDIDKAEKGKK